MSISQLIGKGIAVANRSIPLIVVLFVFGFIWNMISIPMNALGPNPGVGPAVGVFLVFIVFMAISVFMQSGSLGYLLKAIKGGVPTLIDFKANALKFFLRVLGTSIIIGLFILILGILTALGFVIGGENPTILSLVLAFIVAVIGMYGVILVFLAPYILVADDTKVMESLKHSIGLMRAGTADAVGVLSLVLSPIVAVAYGLVPGFRQSSYGRTHFVQVLVMGFWLVACSLAIGLFFGFLTSVLEPALGELPTQIVLNFLSSLINAYLSVIVGAVFMLYYLSLKTEAAPAAN